VSAGKPILPVVSPEDATRISGLIAHARAAGFFGFRRLLPLDMSQPELASASVRTLLRLAEAELEKQKKKVAAGCFD
jgi:hypothetical protein